MVGKMLFFQKRHLKCPVGNTGLVQLSPLAQFSKLIKTVVIRLFALQFVMIFSFLLSMNSIGFTRTLPRYNDVGEASVSVFQTTLTIDDDGNILQT